MEGNSIYNNNNNNNLPPGFRFHPTDEELIVHYLKNQATSRPCPVSIIPEIDIYKFDPWQLPEKAEFGEGDEWYFFSPRDRKYPNGIRPNRATKSGYWKATGTDKGIYSGDKYVGIKKSLVFYKGRPPKGSKMDWIMHEYRLTDPNHQPVKHHGSMRLDDWVLCRIYKKRCVSKTDDSSTSSRPQLSFGETTDDISYDYHHHHHHHHQHQQHHQQRQQREQEQEQVTKFPRTHSLSYLLDLDYLGPITHLLNNGPYNNNTTRNDIEASLHGPHQ